MTIRRSALAFIGRASVRAGTALLLLASAPTSASDDHQPPAAPQAVEEPLSTEAPPASKITIVRAHLRGELGHRWVRDIEVWKRDAGRPAVAAQGDFVAYDRVADHGRRALFLGRTDGDLERCLTCDLYEFNDRDVLSPIWHPSGEMIVVLAQALPTSRRHDALELAGPQRGLHTELWAVDPQGRDAWRLTRARDLGGAVLDPRFSFEGDRLAWTERVRSGTGGRWGDWQLAWADFEVRRGLPKLDDIERADPTPWPGWLAVSSFTPDDGGVFLTGLHRDGRGTSVLRYDFESAAHVVIGEIGVDNAHLQPVPRADRQVWASDGVRDAERDGSHRVGAQDLWLRSTSGARLERLTFFSDPASDAGPARAKDGVRIGGTAWAPDGLSLFVHLVWREAGAAAEAIYRLRLDPALVGDAE
ncbi:MAG: hypothetical protein AAGN46_06510 [Acidobacteriota bacterium]